MIPLPMEISAWLLQALIYAFAAIFIISKIIKIRRRPEQKLRPPGPRPWPIIGNLNLLGSIPHQSLHHLSQKYGEMMLLKFGKFPVFIASSPKMAEQFLKVHDAVFASRPPLSAGKHVSYNYSDVSFAPYGPYWREARKIYMTKVLCPKKLDSFEQIRVEETLRLLSRLKSMSGEGKPVELSEHLSRFTLSSICKMIMKGKCFDEEEVDMDEVRAVVKEWFRLTGAFNIGDWIPWLSFLDLQGYVKDMKALRKRIDWLCDYVIDHHLAKRDHEFEDEDEDFVDVLLQRVEDCDEVEFTRDCVRALIMNLLVGAIETSATGIEWAIHEILRQPRTMEKARSELNRVIGRERWVEEKDLDQLPYLNAITMETLRLHPLATLLAPHCALEDCNVAGYNISKGATVLVNVWSINRDPSSWEAPEEFLPERFIGKDIEMMLGSNFALLPFGSGRRRCPGYNLGLKVVRTTLANLLHGFELKLAEGKRAQDISMEENYGLSTCPKHPISIIMEPTLPHYLYSI